MTSPHVVVSLVAEQDKQHFRLLELPNELLEKIKDPQSGRLELKSASSTTGTERQADAVLCTEDKTYKIRQKNSSNSVYVLEASSQTASVLAVAQCESTLELSTVSDSSAIAYIRRLVPLYTSTGSISAGGVASIRELFDSIPLSEQECQISYDELAIAVHPETGRLLRPSAQVKIALWRNILDGVLASGTSFEALGTVADLQSMLESASAVDLAVAQAVLKASGVDQGYGERCVRWLGINLLEVEALHTRVSTPRFLGKWKDLVPEAWRLQAKVELLGSDALLEANGRDIRCNAAKHADDGLDVAGRTSGARRWHDKFKPVK